VVEVVTMSKIENPSTFYNNWEKLTENGGKTGSLTQH